MNAIYWTNEYSATAPIATGTTATLLVGPVPIDHLDNFTLYFHNCSTVTVYVTVKASYDEARGVEDNFPLGSFTNSEAVAVLPASTLIRSMYGHSNPFRYITVGASATAAVTAAQFELKLSGKSHK